MFFSIKYQILKFSQRKEVSSKTEEQKIKSDWQNIIGKINKSALDKSQALYLKKDGELVVGVASNIWLQEMSFYKEEIKKELNKKGDIVKSIRFTIQRD